MAGAMASELLLAAAAASTTITAANGTTVFSLSEDDLREIFVRLPDLRALVRAALTCRPWLRAVRSSRAFRRLFCDLHPAPLIGLFLEIGQASAPSFLPLDRSDPVVNAALRRGDFFLTSLPPSSTGWILVDCRDGYVLLWNGCPDRPSVAALNPVTWALDILPPVPGKIAAGSRRDFAVLGFHLVPSDESFRVACVCADQRGLRVAVFFSETWEWVIRPWVAIGGDCSLKFMAGTLVGRFVFWPYHGEARIVMIDTLTMDVCIVDLPPEVEAAGHNFGIGETRNGELCAVYESDFLLHVWIRRPSEEEDGTEIWGLPTILSLGAEMDRVTHASVLDLQLDLKIVQLRSGLVHLSATCITHVGTLHCWFFSLPLDTMELELLLEGSFEVVAHLYTMAWPPSLVGDDDDDNIGT